MPDNSVEAARKRHGPLQVSKSRASPTLQMAALLPAANFIRAPVH